MTEPMPLHAVPGGRPSRVEERRARAEQEMRELWAEAWKYAKEGDRETALAVFLEANDMGMSFPTDESRHSLMSGTVPLGYARLPFTDWDANAFISHGRDERRPTELDQYAGYHDQNGDYHPPARLTVAAIVKGGVVTGLSLKGAQAVAAHLGLDRPGAVGRVEFNRRGVLELHRQGPAEAGPTGVDG